MIKTRGALFAALAVCLAGCSSNKSEPQGQVVATVDGHEITAADLRAETGNMAPGSANADAVQAEALKRLIVRKLLVAEAKKRGLEKLPETAVLTNQAEDLALVQVLGGKLAEGIPKVSDDEINEFIRDHPANVSQRRLLFVDQLVVPAATDEFVRQLQPLHSLSEAEDLLKKQNLRYQRTAAVMDTAAMDPDQAAQIANVGQHDIFFMRQGPLVQVSGIVDSRLVPLEGKEAVDAVRGILTRQRNISQMQSEMARIIQNGQGLVKINPAYKPKQAASRTK